MLTIGNTPQRHLVKESTSTAGNTATEPMPTTAVMDLPARVKAPKVSHAPVLTPPKIKTKTSRGQPNPTSSLAGAIRLAGAPKWAGKCSAAQKNAGEALERALAQVGSGDLAAKEVWITTGIGLDKSCALPVRLPALIIPGLSMLRALKEAGAGVPTYVVYQATGFIAETNAIAAPDAFVCARRMEDYLRRFVAAAFADVAEHVVFKMGCPYSAHDKQEVQTIADRLEDLRAATPSIDAALAKLETCEKKHSNSTGMSRMYAAANVYYNGADARYPFGDAGVRAKVLIPVGGTAERPFFELTSLIAEQNKRANFPHLITLGSRPTYYAYEALGDPNTAEAFATFDQDVTDPMLLRDLRALQGAAHDTRDTQRRVSRCTMKTVGIIGGMGPQASVRLYHLCIEISTKVHGAVHNKDFPHMLIANVPVPDFIADRGAEACAVDMVEQTIRRLAAAGAEFMVLPCNTMHLHAERFAHASGVPFYSMIEAVVENLQLEHHRTVGLLATPTTLASGLYHKALHKAGMQVLEPAAADHASLAALIGRVIAGHVRDADARLLHTMIDSLLARGCDAVVLGCTELPVLYAACAQHSEKVYDCLDILARRVCQYAYAA